RRIEDDVEGELPGERAPRPGLLRRSWDARRAMSYENIEDSRSEIHRAGEHAREEENRLVFRRISSFAAPRIVFLTARTLTAQHVRPGPTFPRVVNRLVNVDGNPVSGRRLYDPAIVTHHVLPGVGVAFGRLVVHVASLDGVHAETFIQREGAVELALVILDAHRRLVMHDERDTFGLRVRGDDGQVVIRIGLGKRESISVRDPIAVPAEVPSLDERPAQAVGSREIDVALGVRRRRAVLRSLTPGVDVDVHAPPDAVVLHRRDPTRVLNPARWVELEAQHRGREVLDAVG